MNEQERDVIADIFRRLEQVANQPRDPEAERFIADKVRQQPYAPYAMAQAIFVQEQALANLTAENERLRAAREQRGGQPQGGFLSSLFGGGASAAPRRESAPERSPWTQTAQPGGGGPWGNAMQARGAGGGFLQSALSTAAGVAGGVMIANALSSAFGGADQAVQGALDKTGLADLGGAKDDAQGAADNSGITDPLYQDASQNDAEDYDEDDFGGGGDDWV